MERIIRTMEEKYLVPSPELVPGGPDNIRGIVEYTDYRTLC